MVVDAPTFSVVNKTLRDLTPDSKNANKGTPRGQQLIEQSLREYGAGRSILIDKNGKIIAGNKTAENFGAIGLEDVLVVQTDGSKLVAVQRMDLDLNDKAAQELAIADNRAGQVSLDWDIDVLKDLDVDLAKFWSSEELAVMLQEPVPELLTDEDDVPPVPEEPETVLGDLYVLGNHRLLCGDSTSITDVERLMDGQKADMVFTDPPYGMFLDTDYSAIKGSAKAKIQNKGGRKYDKIIGDHNDFSPELINTIFACFPDCSEMFIFGADYFAELLPEKNEGSWIVWDKRGSEEADKIVGSSFELCWSRQKHKREIARIKWMGAFGPEDAKNRTHPSQKPISLAEWFFSRWGTNGDVVADLYGGSGSTVIAAEKTSRRAFLMELDPKYCDVIVRRWEEATGKKAVRHANGQTT